MKIPPPSQEKERLKDTLARPISQLKESSNRASSQANEKLSHSRVSKRNSYSIGMSYAGFDDTIEAQGTVSYND